MNSLPCRHTYVVTVDNAHWGKVNLESRVDCTVIRIKEDMQLYSRA